jgi:hypothetical protein
MNDESKTRLVETAITSLQSSVPSLSREDAVRVWESLLEAIDTKAHWMVVPQEVMDFYREHRH